MNRDGYTEINLYIGQLMSCRFGAIRTRGCILQQYLDKVTLDLSKGRLFTFSWTFYSQKIRNVQFHNL